MTAATIPNNALVGGYLIASVCFIVALKALSSPRRARLGNLIGVGGMVVAVGLTLADEHAGPYGIIPIGMVVGAADRGAGVPAGAHDRHAAAGGRLQRGRRAAPPPWSPW